LAAMMKIAEKRLVSLVVAVSSCNSLIYEPNALIFSIIWRQEGDKKHADMVFCVGV
jgi:hypothetical protein